MVATEVPNGGSHAGDQHSHGQLERDVRRFTQQLAPRLRLLRRRLEQAAGQNEGGRRTASRERQFFRNMQVYIKSPGMKPLATRSS